MRPHVGREDLARGLLVAVDNDVAPFRVTVPRNAEARPGQADVLWTEERKPTEDRRVSQKLAPGESVGWIPWLCSPGRCRQAVGEVRARRSLTHKCSSSGRFLCLGFLRADFGSSSCAAGTAPTRSRAI